MIWCIYWATNGDQIPTLVSGEIQSVGVLIRPLIRAVALKDDAVFVFLYLHDLLSMNSSIPNERQSDGTAAPEPESNLQADRRLPSTACLLSLWEWVKDAWCGGPDLLVHKVLKFFICMGLFNIAALVVLITLKLCKGQ